MANEKVLKVFHAARQDIEICWHRARNIPHPIFDTQVAAMVLGHGDSISYDQLVQRITGDTLDKSNRFTDWTRRPLSPAQVTYAVSDVTHLRDVYTALVADLGRRGRTDWMDDEMEILTSPDTYRAEPARAWMRLKTRVRKPKELGGADRGRGLARARGADPRRAALTRAQGRHHRRHRHAGADHAGAARVAALAAQGLRALEMGRRHSRSGASAGSRAIRRPCRRSSGRRLAPNGAATVELLKVLLRMTSERHGVAAKVIATVDDLDRIAGDDEADVPALKGWRRELFGEKALDLKHGRLALAIERSRVVAVERD